MRITKPLIAAAVMGACLTAANAASAYVVCDRDGDDCWHTDTRYHYPSGHYVFHPDDWYFHQHWDADANRHWREYHEGRGYWKGGVWVTF